MPHVSLESHQHQSNFGPGPVVENPGRVMPTIWTYLRATAVIVGSSAALLTGGIAHADPAPIPDPMQNMQNIPQPLIASAANAPQILQNIATALRATPPSSPAAIQSIPGLTSPAAAAPAAAAASAIPGLSSIPGLAPAAPAIPGL